MRRWLAATCDPVRFLRGFTGLAWYLADWRAYSRLPGAETIHLVDTDPRVHDRRSHTSVDTHYHYVNGWAMRRIVAQEPTRHVDIGSQTMFVNLLSAVVPLVFVDYRPLLAHLAGLESLGASILHLPFANESIDSLSCLHVIEHIGLGRYGDPLDPQGTHKAARELERVLARGGSLFLALPIGKPRICFNAQRIHAPETVCDLFSGLRPVEFSGVDDEGQLVEHATFDRFKHCDYACGMYWFQKPG